MARLRFFIPFFAAALLVSVSAYAAPKPGLLYVQVKESKLRAKPQFWASSVANLTYGTALTSEGAAPSDKSWIKVRLGESEGFVHVSAVTSRKVVLSSSANANKVVDPSSVVMAGKGFNSQVENSYKTSRGLDFNVVDEVEKNKVDPDAEAAFIAAGKLNEK